MDAVPISPLCHASLAGTSDTAGMKHSDASTSRALAWAQGIALVIGVVMVPLAHTTGSWWPLVVGGLLIALVGAGARRWIPGNWGQRPR